MFNESNNPDMINTISQVTDLGVVVVVDVCYTFPFHTQSCMQYEGLQSFHV